MSEDFVNLLVNALEGVVADVKETDDLVYLFTVRGVADELLEAVEGRLKELLAFP
jgi:hypothetical protein